MNRTSTLQPDGSLRELPEMEKPRNIDYEIRDDPFNIILDNDWYNRDMKAYNAALSQCRELEVEGWTPEAGKVYEEGKDYRVVMRFREILPDRKPLGNTGTLDASHGSYSVPVAVPISDRQEELWKEVLDIIRDIGSQPKTNKSLVKELKEKGFTITRKQQ